MISSTLKICPCNCRQCKQVLKSSSASKLAKFADADLMTQAQNDAFQVLYSKGVFKGVGDLRMDPVGSTSRCEFAALVHRLDGLNSK